MTIYTVHEPPQRAGESAPDPERFIFVRDGFSFWAFLLAPLWMIRHRLWLMLLGYVLVTVALQFVLGLLGASVTVAFAVGALLALLVGFEAATLRRFGLARRRWRHVGTVVGDDLDTAERRFFDAWSRHSSPAPSSPAATMPIGRRPWAAPDVIGLFPEPGAPR